MRKQVFTTILAYLLIAPAVYATLTPSGLGGNTLGLSCSNGQVPEWNGAGFTVCLDPAGGGTVTSVGLNTDATTSSIFANTANAFTGSPVTAAGAFTVTFKTQVKNKFLGGPTTGADAAPTYRLLVGADLPLPGASSLGGVFSKAAVSHQFLTAIVAADGSVTSAQPAFTDISGTATGAQLPNPSSSTLGGVQSKAVVTHQWINTISTSGVPASTQPACSDLSDGTASCSTDTTVASNISSGTLPAGRMPALTGDVTSSAGAVATTVAKIQGTTVTGTTGTGNVLFQTGFVEEWVVNAQGTGLTNGTYYVLPYSAVGRKVVSVRIACATSGTVTADLKIGGTNITTCNGISVTSTPGTTTCDTGSTSTLAATGILTLVTTSNSGCTDFYANVLTTRQ